ncbi:hypothetical protein E2562_005288 [Oryza meyeriana var. granulata]|uniref:Uncharacterized protein n=1 Tax=Oryza meyeriana var. granulata TaxID=110450 RepID=A0A6G1EEZ0_9ORYZ|nr:hypothetical protein E2562_005288 [Oryza meyeriana var. granulata]
MMQPSWPRGPAALRGQGGGAAGVLAFRQGELGRNASESLPRGAWAMVERLQEAATAERAELERERSTLVEERAQLEEARKLFEARGRATSVAYEQPLSKIKREQEALEEVHDEAVAAQMEARVPLQVAAECEEAADRRARDLASWEDQVVKCEEAGTREETLAKREDTVLRVEAELHLHV